MKKIFIKALEILSVLALVLGLFVVVHQSSDYKKGQQDYEEAEQLANLPEREEISTPSVETVRSRSASEDPYAAMLKENIDFSALKEVNSDVLGWIDIPGTEISYPILQGTDNNYYLEHTWKGEPNAMGSIFLESQVDPELADFNTIIYGHRMRNLSMFGSLKYYEDISYWEENPSVYVVIEGEAYRYDIYAAYKAEPEDIIYRLKVNGRPQKQELIRFGLENSVIDTGIIPTTYDRILTLSTCTGSNHANRWVVQVEASDAPEGAGGVFEGTDDIADETKLNSGDSLIFAEPETPNEKVNQNKETDISKPALIVGILVIFVVVESILIAAAFLYFRSIKKN